MDFVSVFEPFDCNALTFGFERKMLNGMRVNQNENIYNNKLENCGPNSLQLWPIHRMVILSLTHFVCMVVLLAVWLCPIAFCRVSFAYCTNTKTCTQ